MPIQYIPIIKSLYPQKISPIDITKRYHDSLRAISGSEIPCSLPPRFSSGESSPDAAVGGGGESSKRKSTKGPKDPKKTKKTKKQEEEEDEGEVVDHDHESLPGHDEDDDDEDGQDGMYGLNVAGILKMDQDEKGKGGASKKPASRRGGSKKKPAAKKRDEQAHWLKSM